jgi:hypothetical protein
MSRRYVKRSRLRTSIMGGKSNMSKEQLVAELIGIGRDDLVARIMNFPSQTRLDFTPEYLNSQSTDQLRHILLSAALYLSR